MCVFFFFNDTATTEIYTLSLHDALPIYKCPLRKSPPARPVRLVRFSFYGDPESCGLGSVQNTACRGKCAIMNRAEKRRQRKLSKKAARVTKPVQSASSSPEQQTLTIQQAIDRAVQHHNAGRLPEIGRASWRERV